MCVISKYNIESLALKSRFVSITCPDKTRRKLNFYYVKGRFVALDDEINASFVKQEDFIRNAKRISILFYFVFIPLV